MFSSSELDELEAVEYDDWVFTICPNLLKDSIEVDLTLLFAAATTIGQIVFDSLFLIEKK